MIIPQCKSLYTSITCIHYRRQKETIQINHVYSYMDNFVVSLIFSTLYFVGSHPMIILPALSLGYLCNQLQFCPILPDILSKFSDLTFVSNNANMPIFDSLINLRASLALKGSMTSHIPKCNIHLQPSSPLGLPLPLPLPLTICTFFLLLLTSSSCWLCFGFPCDLRSLRDGNSSSSPFIFQTWSVNKSSSPLVGMEESESIPSPSARVLYLFTAYASNISFTSFKIMLESSLLIISTTSCLTLSFEYTTKSPFTTDSCLTGATSSCISSLPPKMKSDELDATTIYKFIAWCSTSLATLFTSFCLFLGTYLCLLAPFSHSLFLHLGKRQDHGQRPCMHYTKLTPIHIQHSLMGLYHIYFKLSLKNLVYRDKNANHAYSSLFLLLLVFSSMNVGSPTKLVAKLKPLFFSPHSSLGVHIFTQTGTLSNLTWRLYNSIDHC